MYENTLKMQQNTLFFMPCSLLVIFTFNSVFRFRRGSLHMPKKSSQKENAFENPRYEGNNVNLENRGNAWGGDITNN